MFVSKLHTHANIHIHEHPTSYTHTPTYKHVRTWTCTCTCPWTCMHDTSATHLFLKFYLLLPDHPNL